ncbi:MAG: acyl--CoA ligase [Clostridia bacterium]|nr:acyl--CoA ligase [Clostridia bacterium]
MAEVKTVSTEKVWMKYYSEETKNASFPRMKVYSFLKEVNKTRLHDTAIYYYGTRITVKKLIERIDECADAFAALGVTQGHTVSLLSASTPESIITLYALNKMGATVNAIDPRMDVKSISRMVCNSGSEILMAIDIAYPKVAKILSEINQKHIIIQSSATSLPPLKKIAVKIASRSSIPYGKRGIISWDTFIEGAKNGMAQEAEYVGDATVAITYTGGTTGFPKGVMLTNDSMNAVAFNFIHAGIVHEKGQRFLGIMPIFSSYGLVCGIHMPLTLGLELALIPRFYPLKMGEYVKKYKPEHMIATPAFYEILIDSEEMKNFDLSFVLTLGSGGDSMNAGLETKMQAFMDSHGIRYPLAQGYGMSEVSAAATFCVNDRYKKGSVGIPCVTTTIGIFDPETGEELGYNTPGEVCITGESMMKGYFNNKEETDFVMRKHADGKVWIHSGDIGSIDEDGFVYIQGRVKRMITRFDGHKVFPITIESFIAEHELVHSCSVIGVNDRERTQGQYPMAVIELVAGVDVSRRDEICREIYHKCLEQLEERGRPVAVVCVDEVPLTAMGKNDYRTLEKDFKYFDYVAWAKEA